MRDITTIQPTRMSRPNEVKDRFAANLRSALMKEFGELPSNAVIAREFNLRAYGTEPVSQESVRRWVQGICMPDEKKMRVLASWLDLDLKGVFFADGPDYAMSNGNGHGAADGALGRAQEIRVPKEHLKLLRMFESLPANDKKLVVELTRKLTTRAQR